MKNPNVLRMSLLLLLMLSHSIVYACSACEKQQPKVLRGITHGTGPQSNWDFVIIWATVLIVAVSMFYSIKWLIRPGEKSAAHIKRTILNND